MANQQEYQRSRPDSKIAKIVVDRDLCISAASCIGVAPEAFELDAESKAILKNTADSVDDETLMMAAQSCPTKAILLFDNDGKQIYP
ncbi:MAG: ferredoxin [Candidatus Niyogibacteria bacterium CG10_big_fil_rev_8_21_14_0_10_42_19]|uniref:Ferredoxin n=1 Tax=Candidatus Niyogibacteria bacterium CG10_big_fil_rev_8_21_14_0_10_42_19 TaxID=1974725 RepID=A0A2H0TGC1_9BACT|nr:MAG: ferredoxin [Candidatus Niyogibacteria bacterium CG10_big_fil_rev_8_21_14_0_10_42_19]